VVEAANLWNQSANPTYHLRSPAQISSFYEGLALVWPGVVSVTRWLSVPDQSDLPEVDQYCGVGRKQ